MADAPPPDDVWLEQSRMNGMLIGSITWGIFFQLTAQCLVSLNRSRGGRMYQIPMGRKLALNAYVISTFLLATVGFACNARYTQEIWIDRRGPGISPTILIQAEFDFWINRLAIDCYYVMGWIMDVLLLHRAFVVWNYNPLVVMLMSSLYVSTVGTSIAVMVFAQRHAIFSHLGVQLAYLSLSVSTNIVFTLLVAGRLFAIRNRIRDTLGAEYSSTFSSVASTLVESSSLYSFFGIIFIVSFALQSNVQNLIFLAISHIQGIAQLLIILRVADGREFDRRAATLTAAGHSNSIAFTPPTQVDIMRRSSPGEAVDIHELATPRENRRGRRISDERDAGKRGSFLSVDSRHRKAESSEDWSGTGASTSHTERTEHV
ncbi:hypothetical protein BD626DRAFT_483530 [Schizophyllum amplum]|uniref:Uncharacterized protein n=1 Tax=Schizophyllum amplum TaxID=97359 RepID=A0A550CPG0_9AGAR|nr:hypothetical protein BD626DRAFT_483530 [Auriculariopsis ampla]